MLSRLSRNFLTLLAWLIPLSGAIVINIVIATSNYLGCRTSFELLCYEMFPISRDNLIGWLFEAFAPEAAQAHFFALSVALTLWIGYFMFFHQALNILQIYLDRKTYMAINDNESAAVAKQLIIKESIIISSFLIPIILASIFDVILFRYRSAAAAMGIEDPVTVATTLPNWKLLPEKYGHLFSISVARWGAYGYLGLTAIGCLCLEYPIMKLGESWAKFCGCIEEMLSGGSSDQSQIFYGYDGDGNPVYDPNATIVYDTDGNPLETTSQITGGEPENEPMTPTLTTPETSSQNDNNQPQTTGANITWPPNSESEELHEVINEVKGERVKMSYALTNPQLYWVDPETHEIWNADFHRRLVEEEESKVA